MEWLSNHDIWIIVPMAIIAGISLGMGDGLRSKKSTYDLHCKVCYMITGGLWLGAIVLVSLVEGWSDSNKWSSWLFGLWIIPMLAIFAFLAHSWGESLSKKF